MISVPPKVGKPGIRNRTKAAISRLVVGLALVACASTPENADGPRELTDGHGRTVSLPAVAERIVSIAPSNTELLYAVGAIRRGSGSRR